MTPVGTREPLSALAGPPLDIPPTSLLMEETSWTPEHCHGRSGHGDMESDCVAQGCLDKRDSRAHPQEARCKQRARSHSASRDCQFSAFDRRTHALKSPERARTFSCSVGKDYDPHRWWSHDWRIFTKEENGECKQMRHTMIMSASTNRRRSVFSWTTLNWNLDDGVSTSGRGA